MNDPVAHSDVQGASGDVRLAQGFARGLWYDHLESLGSVDTDRLVCSHTRGYGDHSQYRSNLLIVVDLLSETGRRQRLPVTRQRSLWIRSRWRFPELKCNDRVKFRQIQPGFLIVGPKVARVVHRGQAGGTLPVSGTGTRGGGLRRVDVLARRTRRVPITASLPAQEVAVGGHTPVGQPTQADTVRRGSGSPVGTHTPGTLGTCAACSYWLLPVGESDIMLEIGGN